MQTTHKKLIDAGFTVLRRGDAREPIIKQASPCGTLGNISWKTMEKFPTKTARDRRWKELEEAAEEYLQQEQPEVDLEKEAKECWDYIFPMGWDKNSRMAIVYEEFMAFAHHFYSLGLNARKED